MTGPIPDMSIRSSSLPDSPLTGVAMLSGAVIGTEAPATKLEPSQTPGGADRVNILGVGATPLDLGRAAAMLERWRREGRREYVCLISVHGLVTAQRNPAIRRSLNGCGLAAEDGMPLVWWSRLAGYSHARRVCGADLLDEVCRHGLSRHYRHYFYGATPQVLDLLTERLQRRHPGLVVAGACAPPFRALTPDEDAEHVAAINATRPDFVWVGLGMPKQEQWMVDHLGRVEATALIGVGAAVDFHAGTKPRAPVWMQRSGLEWLFRLGSEPRRLSRRYVIDNALFIGLALQQAAGRKFHAIDR